MATILSYFKLLRVHNCLIASLAVAAGRYLLPDSGRFVLPVIPMIVIFLLCGFGNVLNDLLDIESDRINHPRRPLPSGSISFKAASILAGLLAIASLALTLLLPPAGQVMAILILLLLIWYDLRLKHTPYWGNLVVSLLGALAFLFGGAESEASRILAIPGPVVPAVFAFLMHAGREIIKDVADRGGDTLTGSRTAAAVFGSKKPLRVANLFLSALILFSLTVYFLGWFSLGYFLITLFLVVIPLIIQMIWLEKSLDEARLRLVSRLIKLEMIPGIVALLIGRTY